MRRQRRGRPKSLYTVYDNRTDQPVAVYEPARRAAALMGIKFASFYSIVSLARRGKNDRWHITITPAEEGDTA